MKKRLLSLCMALLLMITALPFSVYAAEEVEINETNFPDMNFREYVRKYDIDSNGMLSAEEIAVVTSIDVQARSIEDLKGVECFTSLKILYCGGNQLSSLDVSNCVALTELNCSWNNLTSLDVSNHTALTSLVCFGNDLNDLNVSNCIALTFLDCAWNSLISLDVSECIAIVSLDCGNNKLSGLDVSKCTGLRDLHCYNNQLDTLDVSKNIALTSLNCPNNKLSSLDLDKKIESLCIDAQTSRLEIQKTSNEWTADLSKLVGAENTKKVELQEGQGWQYDAETGVASYTGESMPEELIYYYGGNNVPKDKMDVTVTLFESEEQQYVVMKQGAEQAYVNGIIAPTTQYATGYAKMENISGTMQLPLRYIAEVNGFTVDYDADTEKTKVTNPADGTYLLITPGSNAVTKHMADGTLIGSSNAPLAFTMHNGVTMGPLRFTCEALDLVVSYQETSHGIYVVITQEVQTTENALAKIEEAYQKGL